MKRAIACGLLLLTLVSGALWAAVKPPQEVIQDTSARMLSALRQNYAALKQDSSQIYGLVDQIVLPNFDFELMSRWVLGRRLAAGYPGAAPPLRRGIPHPAGSHLRQGAVGIRERGRPGAAATGRGGR